MAEEKIDALLELLKQRKFTQVYDELKEMRPILRRCLSRSICRTR